MWRIWLLLTVLFSFNARAQFSYQHWVIGEGARVVFDSNAAYYAGDLSLQRKDYLHEASSSIADNNHKLLLFSNAETVLDSATNAIQNSALPGDVSSNNGSLFIPKPGSCDSLYHFVTPALGKKSPLHFGTFYRNRGRWDSGAYQVLGIDSVAEAMAAAMHENRRDVWLVTRQVGGANLHLYLITPRGIRSFGGFTSSLIRYGQYQQTNFETGEMSFSKDAKSFVLVTSAGDILLWDFDASTGLFSNERQVKKRGGEVSPYAYENFCQCPVPLTFYSCEFSPDARYLYVCSNLSFSLVYRLDLQLPTDSIWSQRHLLQHSSETLEGVYGGMEIGADNRIYLARYAKQYLSAIENADAGGSFVEQKLSLGKKCLGGLPNTIKNYPQFDQVPVVSLTDTVVCGISPFELEVDAPAYWRRSGSSSIEVDSTGMYYAMYYDGCKEHVLDSAYVQIVNPHHPRLPDTAYLCNGNPVFFELPVDSFLNSGWVDDFSPNEREISEEGIYPYWIASYCGDTVDSELYVLRDEVAGFEPNEKLDFCSGEQTFSKYSEYITWKDGFPDAIRNFDQPGTYYFRLENQAGCIYEGQVEVYNSCYSFKAPNIFSPNGDGINDLFILDPELAGQVQQFEMSIYNRWGAELFRTQDPAAGWNGYATGTQTPQGVYYYKYFFTDSAGKSRTGNGSLTLVR